MMPRRTARPTFHLKTRYRSKFEAEVAKLLHANEIPFRYEEERLPYELACVYVPDITLPGGVLVEVKGRLTPPDRRKLLEVKRSHPGRDIRLLFQNAAQKLSRAKKSQTYGQWATRNGFVWAQGPEIPKEWLDYARPND